jgi:hypothetical protein
MLNVRIICETIEINHRFPRLASILDRWEVIRHMPRKNDNPQVVQNHERAVHGVVLRRKTLSVWIV